jgi:hypothetical protein
MLEYPSRSNLKCFPEFYEAPALPLSGGDELFDPTVIVDITLAGETIILADQKGFEP